ncbi:hypothetical protein JNJ66_06025 [Candidatus Saccharibacteria bacterium]|nr:hypothetical protein [Candidatus Saccharibacteria bacterium]
MSERISRTTLDPDDLHLVDGIVAELGNEADDEAYLRRALELGAGHDVLVLACVRFLGRDTVDRNRVTGLRYVPIISRDRGDETARRVVESLCLTPGDDHHSPYHHLLGFLRDGAAQRLFATRGQVMGFATSLMRYHAPALLSSDNGLLREWLASTGVMEEGDLICIELAGALRLYRIADEHQLGLVLRLDPSSRLKVAERCPASSWSLVLMAYCIAQDEWSDRFAVLRQKIDEHLQSRPRRAALIYRLYCDGVLRYQQDRQRTRGTRSGRTPEEAMAAAMHDSWIRAVLASQRHGWHFLQLDGNLRVTIRRPRGLPLILQHQPGDDVPWQLQPGDEVMVRPGMIRGRHGHIGPAGQLYTLPLPPTRPLLSELAALPPLADGRERLQCLFSDGRRPEDLPLAGWELPYWA